MRRHTGRAYEAQWWYRGPEGLDPSSFQSIRDLSYDAALHVCMAHLSLENYTVRIWSQDDDWNEVWDGNGHREGTFGQTTLVRVESR